MALKSAEAAAGTPQPPKRAGRAHTSQPPMRWRRVSGSIRQRKQVSTPPATASGKAPPETANRNAAGRPEATPPTGRPGAKQKPGWAQGAFHGKGKASPFHDRPPDFSQRRVHRQGNAGNRSGPYWAHARGEPGGGPPRPPRPVQEGPPTPAHRRRHAIAAPERTPGLSARSPRSPPTHRV